MNLIPEERETYINYDDSSNNASLGTFNKSLITKMDKLCQQHPKIYKLTNEIIIENKICGKEYEFPKNLISIRQPNKRKMTDEQKQAASERMKNTLENEKAKKNKKTK